MVRLVQPSVGSGLDGLEILPDGRFIATFGGNPNNNQPAGVLEIKPSPDPMTGRAETNTIFLSFDTAIVGGLNGLTSPTAAQTTVAIDIKPGRDREGAGEFVDRGIARRMKGTRDRGGYCPPQASCVGPVSNRSML